VDAVIQYFGSRSALKFALWTRESGSTNLKALSLQIVYCVLYKLVHTEPPLVRVRAGDYEKGTVPPRLGTVASAFECRLINMKILPSKIVRSTFSLITSRALSVANIVVIFEAIPTNDFKNA
jgi:hypothetical protein